MLIARTTVGDIREAIKGKRKEVVATLVLDEDQGYILLCEDIFAPDAGKVKHIPMLPMKLICGSQVLHLSPPPLTASTK